MDSFTISLYIHDSKLIKTSSSSSSSFILYNIEISTSTIKYYILKRYSELKIWYNENSYTFNKICNGTTKLPGFPADEWLAYNYTEYDMVARKNKIHRFLLDIIEIAYKSNVPAEAKRLVDNLFEISFIHRFALLNDMPTMTYLLESQKYCVHASDQNRGTLLHYAVAKNHFDMIKYLLLRGASPYVIDQFGLSPYMIAIKLKYQHIIDLFNDTLISFGIPIPSESQSNSDVNLHLKPTKSALPLQYTHLPSERNYLVLINPFGGTKTAPQIWENVVKIIFDMHGIRSKMVETTHMGHAGEIVHSLDLSTYTGVIAISGDGLFHEIINGLGSRNDNEAALNFPVGLIPGGTGNGLSVSLGLRDPVLATLQIARGFVRPMDLMNVKQPSSNTNAFSLLSVTWGLISDIDFQSEEYRWMGELRFTYVAIQKIMATRPPYNCKLHYLPATSKPHFFDYHRKLPVVNAAEAIDSDSIGQNIKELSSEELNTFFHPNASDLANRIPKVCTQRFCRRCQVFPHEYKPQDIPDQFNMASPLSGSRSSTFKLFSPRGSSFFPPGFSESDNAMKNISSFVPPSESWVTIADSLDFLVIGNLSSVSSNAVFCPNAHFADGAIDICYARGCDRMDGINLMLDVETGSHLSLPKVNTVKASHVVLEPIDDSLIDLDGERYPNVPTYISILPGQISLMS